MELTQITKQVNTLLAGEQLSYTQLRPYLDQVIDDINSQLNSVYPTFSELPESVSNYMFFPDNYVRQVVCYGAAYYFYLADEEGSPTAMGYAQRYKQNMFYMVRDWLHAVPLIFQDCDRNGGNAPLESTTTDTGLGIPSI